MYKLANATGQVGSVLHQGPPSDLATRVALQVVFEHRLHLVCYEGQWLALPKHN